MDTTNIMHILPTHLFPFSVIFSFIYLLQLESVASVIGIYKKEMVKIIIGKAYQVFVRK